MKRALWVAILLVSTLLISFTTHAQGKPSIRRDLTRVLLRTNQGEMSYLPLGTTQPSHDEHVSRANQIPSTTEGLDESMPTLRPLPIAETMGTTKSAVNEKRPVFITACSIQVQKNVTAIKLQHSKLLLEMGQKKTIKATVLPIDATNKELEWSTDTPLVATVDQTGMVWAKSVGIARITAKAKAGNKTESCTVEVKEHIDPAIVFQYDQLTILRGQQMVVVLEKTKIEADEVVTLTTSAIERVKILDNKTLKIEGIAEGNAIITATIEANARHGKLMATCTVTVSESTPIDDAALDKVVITPNPFLHQLRIRNGDLKGSFILFNALGVASQSGTIGNIETVLNTQELPVGFYLLQLTTENGASKTYRLVKQ